MNIKIRRIVLSGFVLGLVASGLAMPAGAQAQSEPPQVETQQLLVDTTRQWGSDDWCYVLERGGWVRTIYSRQFPFPGNSNVFDLFENGQFVRRLDVTAPMTGLLDSATRQALTDDASLKEMLKELNRLQAIHVAR